MKAVALSLISSVTLGHKASQCFEQGKLLGGASEVINALTFSDLSLLKKVGADHIITSVKVCTNRKLTLIKGVQVVYGKYDDQGEIIDPILMHAHGNVDQTTSLCENFYVKQGESITAIVYRYDSDGIKQLRILTPDQSVSYGVNETGDIQIFSSYSTSSNAFFGFVGRREGIDEGALITALGLISYDYQCVKDEQTRLGQDFSWDETPKVAQQQLESSIQELIEPGALKDSQERIDEMREVFDRMTEWQRIFSYSTFGLNAFFLLWGLLYCICKCCFCCRPSQPKPLVKKGKEEKKLIGDEDSSRLELTNMKSSKVEMDTVPPLIKHVTSKGASFEEDEVHKAQSMENLNPISSAEQILQVQPMIQYEQNGSKDWYQPKYSQRITPDGKQMEIVLEVPVGTSFPDLAGAVSEGAVQPHTINDDWAEMTNAGERSWIAEVNKPGERRIAQQSSDGHSQEILVNEQNFSTGQQVRSHQVISPVPEEDRDQEMRRLSADYMRQIAVTLQTYKQQLGEGEQA